MTTQIQNDKPIREIAQQAVTDRYTRRAAEYNRFVNHPGVIRHADGVLEVPDNRPRCITAFCNKAYGHVDPHNRESKTI